MKKLILVALLLVALLAFSAWAKAANFDPRNMFQSINRTITPQSTTNQAVKGAATTPTPTPFPIEILITLTPNGFVPDVIMISAETKITWVNKSAQTATLSSDPVNKNPQLNLGDFDQNGSVSYVFPSSGRYSYENSKIPSQKGVIVVK